MYPELGHIGPIPLRTYTLLIDLGLLIGLGILAWRGRAVEGRAVGWVDVGIGGIVGGVIGARALLVATSRPPPSRLSNCGPAGWNGTARSPARC